MRLTAAGWSRDCGATEIFDVDLVEIRTADRPTTFRRNDPVLSVDLSPHPSARGAVRSVTLNCHANLRLGGDYKIRVNLSKREIARLFYLTHKREIHGLTDRFFPPDAEADEAA
jgi:hypothetical protein